MGRLRTRDVVDGWTVLITRTNGTAFVAIDGDLGPLRRAFFVTRRAARVLVKQLREHGMNASVVRARIVLSTE